jgi:hypothetical protein
MVITWTHIATLCRHNGIYCYVTGKACALECCPFVEARALADTTCSNKFIPVDTRELKSSNLFENEAPLTV